MTDEHPKTIPMPLEWWVCTGCGRRFYSLGELACMRCRARVAAAQRDDEIAVPLDWQDDEIVNEEGARRWSTDRRGY